MDTKKTCALIVDQRSYDRSDNPDVFCIKEGGTPKVVDAIMRYYNAISPWTLDSAYGMWLFKTIIARYTGCKAADCITQYDKMKAEPEGYGLFIVGDDGDINERFFISYLGDDEEDPDMDYTVTLDDIAHVDTRMNGLCPRFCDWLYGESVSYEDVKIGQTIVIMDTQKQNVIISKVVGITENGNLYMNYYDCCNPERDHRNYLKYYDDIRLLNR